MREPDTREVKPRTGRALNAQMREANEEAKRRGLK